MATRDSKVWRACALVVFLALCAGAADALLGSVTRADIEKAYFIALTWQDLIAGLLAGAGALWAASIAYDGAMTAAKDQITFLEQQESDRRLKDRFNAQVRLFHSLVLLRETLRLRAKSLPAGEGWAPDKSWNVRNVYAPGLDALHQDIGLLPQNLIRPFYEVCAWLREFREKTGTHNTDDLKAELERIAKAAGSLIEIMPDGFLWEREQQEAKAN